MGISQPDAEPAPGSVEDQAADWLMRSHEGLDPADLARRAAWLAADPAHARAYARLERGWAALDALADDPALDAWRGQARIGGAARPPSRAASWMPLALAASLAAVIVGGAWVWHGREGLVPSAQPEQHYASALGQVRVVGLADGSRITLDADSAVAVRLAPQWRAIRLERGQAFFQVAHDAARPFVVDAGAQAVVAVGTAFAVKRGARQVVVALTQGKVRVGSPARDGSGRPALATGGGQPLVPGQTLTWSLARREAVVVSGNAADAAAWREGRLYFDHTPLADALDDFNRHGAVSLRLADPALATLPVSGVFRADNAQGFARALVQLFPVSAARNGREIVLSRAP